MVAYMYIFPKAVQYVLGTVFLISVHVHNFQIYLSEIVYLHTHTSFVKSNIIETRDGNTPLPEVS